MREIKFRAWDKEEKLMLYDIQLYLEHKDKDGNEYDGYEDWKFDDFLTDSDIEVMQFTGLLDKNGKEIYEGDIVRILYTDWMSKSDADPRTLEQYKIDISRVGVVEYFYDRFNLYFPNRGGVTTGSLSEGDHGEKEIIGNIYENPELLTKGETKQ